MPNTGMFDWWQDGKALLEEACNTEDCPALSEWTEWTECSASCGGGARARARQCLLAGTEQQPSVCVGESRESEECGQTACPSWGPWTDWTSCTARHFQTSPQLGST